MAEPFNAAKEADHMMKDFVNKRDDDGLRKEISGLKPADRVAALRALKSMEEKRESGVAGSGVAGGSLHEVKIDFGPGPNGALKDVYTVDVKTEDAGKKAAEDAAKKNPVYDAGAGTAATGPGTKKGPAPETSEQTTARQRTEAAQREQAERQAEAQRVQTEAVGLLKNLQDHDKKGFAENYDKLSPRDKALVGQMLARGNRDASINIATGPDGTIREVTNNGKIEYITPGEFLNQTINTHDRKQSQDALKEYEQGMSPGDRAAFYKQLEAEESHHSVKVKYDKKGNVEIHDAGNDKKIYPEGKGASILNPLKRIPH